MEPQQRNVWIGGFLGGALLGALLLSLNARSTPEPTRAAPAPATLPDTRDPIPPPVPAGQQASGMPTFDELADEVARSQGGKISLAQMMAIARITGGGMPDNAYGHALPMPGPSVAMPPDRPRLAYGTGAPERRQGVDPVRSASRDALSAYGFRDEPAASSPDRLNARNGQPMISVGDGFTSNGSYYVQSGPDGAVNARTGEYTPLTDGM